MRKNIKEILSRGPYSLGEIAKETRKKESAVSRELASMETDGLVGHEQKGDAENGWMRLYHLNAYPIKPGKEEKNKAAEPKSSTKELRLYYGCDKSKFYPSPENVEKIRALAKKYGMEFSAPTPSFGDARTYNLTGSDSLTITATRRRGCKYSVEIRGSGVSEQLLAEIKEIVQ